MSSVDLTLEQALEEARRELAILQAQSQKLSDEARRLAEAIAALEFAKEFFAKRSERDPPRILGPREWLAMAETHRIRDLRRTDAIHQVLRQASQPLSPRDISKVLRQSGRSDTPEEVGATLGYLKNERRARSVEYGKWVAEGAIKQGN